MEKLSKIILHLSPLSLIVAAFVLTYLAIPKIVKFAKKRKLYDMPDARKEHKSPIPALGGISIMAGMIPSLIFVCIQNPSIETLVFIFGLITLFITGVIDDIMLFSAMKRLIIQLIIATCIVLSGVRFPHLFGILGMDHLPLTLIMILNIIIITGIINAFNLIDGINGLAGGLGCISIFILGILLVVKGQTSYAIIAFSAAISYLAFLRYNMKPTFIFMGDNGSLVLGYLVAFFSLKLLQNAPVTDGTDSNTVLKIILAICSIPVMDALRVFTGRMLKGKSPFSPDKTHIHHFLVRKGFSHHRSSLILLALITIHVPILYIIIINVIIVTALTVWLNGPLQIGKSLARKGINRKTIISKTN